MMIDGAIPVGVPIGEKIRPEQKPEVQPTGLPPSGSDALKAGFMTESIWGSTALATPNTPDENYDRNAWARIKGTDLEPFWESFVEVNNEAREAALASQIREHLAYRKTVEAAGFFSMATVGQIAGAFADPTIFVPGAGLIKSVKGGYAVSRSIASVAAGAATGAAAQEAILLGTQPTRQPLESGLAIGGAALLGGLLGGAASATLNTSANNVALRAWKELDELSGPNPAGAAAVKKASMDDLTIDGAIARGVVAASRKLTPGIRLATTMVAKAREVGLKAVDGTFYMKMMNEGEVPFEGPALEVMARMNYASRYGNTLREHEGLYATLRKEEGFTLSKTQFNEEVGIALRNGDRSGLTNEVDRAAVEKAAAIWRRQVLEPFKRDMIEAGLIPADVEIATADSYFMRLYKRQMIKENENTIVERLTEHFDAQLREKFGEERTKMQARVQELEQANEDMKVSPQERLNWLQDIEARLQAIRDEQPMGADLSDKITDLQRSLNERRRALRDETDPVAKQNLTKEITSLREEISRFRTENKDALGPFEQEVKDLKRRRRNIESGFAARDARVEKMHDQLVTIEEGTQGLFDRFARDATRAEKELTKVSDERSQEIIDSLVERAEKLSDDLAKTGQRYDTLEETMRKMIEKNDEDFRALNDPAPKMKRGDKGPDPDTITGNVEQAALMANFGKELRKISERLPKMRALQAGRVERLQKTLDKLREAEAFNPAEAQQAIREMLAQVKLERADKALTQGARMQRILDRIGELDPQRNEKLLAEKDRIEKRLAYDGKGKAKPVTTEERAKLEKSLAEVEAKIADDPIAKIIAKNDARRARHERAFYDKWEIRRAGEGLDSDEPQFARFAESIVKEAIDSILHRNPSIKAGPDSFEFFTKIGRGPMRARTFNVPDELLNELGMLSNDVTEVMDRYSRMAAVETGIVRRFGTANLDEVTQEVKLAYDELRKAVGEAQSDDAVKALLSRTPGVLDRMRTMRGRTLKQRALNLIDADERQFYNDFKDMIEVQRGIYGAKDWDSSIGRIVRSANMFNYIRMSGRFVISSLSDMYRTAMVNGFTNTMANGVAPLVRNLGGEAAQMAKEEARLAGNVLERVLHHKMISMMEVGNPFSERTAVENLLHNGTRIATRWNAMAMFQDATETLASIMSQRRLIKGITEGGDDRYLAWAGLGPQLRQRIREQLKTHLTEEGGLKIANTAKWTDEEAALAFRGALNKDVRMTAIVPGVSDKPTFINRPFGAALLQFRAFSLASHQRILLRGLQEKPSLFLSGMTGMIAIGAMVSYLQALGRGKDSFEKWKREASNPGFLLGDALDKSGLFTLAFEGSNAMEKMSQMSGASFNPIKSGLKAAFNGGEEFSVQTHGRFGGTFEQGVFGPTASLATSLGQAMRPVVKGDKATKADWRKLQQVMPFGSFIGMKEILQLWNNDSPYAD